MNYLFRKVKAVLPSEIGQNRGPHEVMNGVGNTVFSCSLQLCDEQKKEENTAENISVLLMFV